MTVKQLVDILQSFPMDTPVRIRSCALAIYTNPETWEIEQVAVYVDEKEDAPEIFIDAMIQDS